MKRNKRANKMIFATLLASVALGTAVVQNSNVVDAAPLGTPLEVVVFQPNPAPSKFLNIWTSNGYALQPERLTNLKIGDTSGVLRTDAVRSLTSIVTGALDAPHYRWYKSEDGRNWEPVPEKEYGHRANLPLKANEEGTTWYQLDTQYYNYATGWALKTHIYSNVAQVNVLTKDINAESIKVTTDSDYIYNTGDKFNNVAYAHADVQPADATGKITWSLASNGEKATIDKDTGRIEAKTNADPGTIQVIATFTNSDPTSPTTIIGRKYVEVGPGLNEPRIKVGQSATFTLQGDHSNLEGSINNGDSTIQWYTKKKNEKDKKAKYLGMTKTLSYTTDIMNEASTDQLYRAQVKVKVAIRNKQLLLVGRD